MKHDDSLPDFTTDVDDKEASLPEFSMSEEPVLPDFSLEDGGLADLPTFDFDAHFGVTTPILPASKESTDSNDVEVTQHNVGSDQIRENSNSIHEHPLPTFLEPTVGSKTPLPDVKEGLDGEEISRGGERPVIPKGCPKEGVSFDHFHLTQH
jgi:hypothetical protein